MNKAERGHDNVVTMPEDFDVFYQREFRPVVGLAYALSGSRIAAEDLAQEAFIAAHQQWEKVGRYESPGAWVRRVGIEQVDFTLQEAYVGGEGVEPSCPPTSNSASRADRAR